VRRASLLVLIVVLAGCGSEPKVAMRLFFSPAASRQQEVRVEKLLRHDSAVARMTFVSKDVGFAYMKKKYPALVAGMKSNSLPDQLDFEAHRSAVAAVIARYKKLVGVRLVQRRPQGP
jgi:cell division protein FtsX